MQVQYSAPFDWIASGLGSIQLLKHGLQKALLLWDIRVIAGTLTIRYGWFLSNKLS